MNEDPTILKRRLHSRRSHDAVVLWLAERLRQHGFRVFTLSEYVKEKRIPDAIFFDGKRLVAVEVETQKRWKPSHASTEDRLARMNALCGFFDETKVVFPVVDDDVNLTGPGFLEQLLAEKD